MNKNYPIYKTTFIDDMRSLVEEAAQNFPESTAISYKENYWDKEVKKVKFPQWRDDVRNLGTALISHGLREQNIAIVGENSYGWCCSFFAVMATGSVTVPVDKELPVEDIDGIITATSCKAVIFGKASEAKIQEILDKGGLKSVEILISVAPVNKLTGAGSRKLATLEEMQERGAQLFESGDNSYYDYKIDTNKLASIVFTSGTTGKGKGVMLSQANIGLDMTLGMYNFDITRKTLHVLPPHHTFGSTVNYVGHLSQGCEVYISSGIKHVSDEIREQQPTHLILVPAFLEVMNRKIWATARKEKKEGLLKCMMKVSDVLRKVGIDIRRKLFASVLSAFGGKLELIICGGAKLDEEIINTFDSLGITILNGYGITECSPLISANRNEYRKPGSVGTPILACRVKIDDPDENGEGEICVKGPNVMLGYYNNPEATAEVFDKDGFFHTGDYGKLDEEGWIYLLAGGSVLCNELEHAESLVARFLTVKRGCGEVIARVICLSASGLGIGVVIVHIVVTEAEICRRVVEPTVIEIYRKADEQRRGGYHYAIRVSTFLLTTTSACIFFSGFSSLVFRYSYN